MKEQDINKILREMKIPGPDEANKEATIKAALDEFHQQKRSFQENNKGIEDERRLTGKLSTFLTFLGGFAMRKSFVISGGVTVVLAILVVALLLPSLSRSRESARRSQVGAVNKHIIDEGQPIDIGAGSKREDKPEPPERYALSNEKQQAEVSVGSKEVSSKLAMKGDDGLAKTMMDRDESNIAVKPPVELEEEIATSEIVTESEGDSLMLAMKDEARIAPLAASPSDPSSAPETKAKERSKSDGYIGGPSIAKKPSNKLGGVSGNVPSFNNRLAMKAEGKSRAFNAPAFNAPSPGPLDSISNEYQETGRDRFETITPNPVKQVSEEPVSTFSIDVDTTSYTFIRRQLNHGVLPQKNAVRVEEMINYFDYDYTVPVDRARPFQPTVAVYPTPWDPDTKLLHIGIKGYDIIPEKKPVTNLVFLIDVSGSMNAHDKLPLLVNSFRMLVNSLDEDDTVAIVVYAGAAGTVLEPTKVKEKGKILSALDQLQAGGSTAGGEGVRRAYELAEANFNKEGVDRVILATDGDFNVGIRDPEELKSFIERKRKTGIFLSVLGFGQGNYNDALMQKLAQNGNGNAAYIDNLNEARKVLVDEASSTLFTIARDVKIQIEFNPKLVAEYRLIGYESRMLRREDFNNDRVDAGDIGSGHSVTAIYEITPVGSKGKLVDDLRYGNKTSVKIEKESLKMGVSSDNDVSFENEASFEDEYAFLKIRYKLPDSEQSQLMDTSITTENEYAQLERVTEDLRFAASVAAFGQILRDGRYTGEFAYEDVIKLAESAVGKDKFGYRHEFLNLVRLAKSVRQ